MQTAARRSRRSSLQIDAILEKFSSSGLSQSAFARQHGITQSFLSVRLKKARAQQTLKPRHSVRFVEIEHPAHSSKPAIRLLLAGDIVVEAPHGFDAVELGVVLSLVKATMRRLDVDRLFRLALCTLKRLCRRDFAADSRSISFTVCDGYRVRGSKGCPASY